MPNSGVDRLSTTLGYLTPISPLSKSSKLVKLLARQRQRLALARAIITSPPILILDESTGALDPSTETKVLEQILAARQGKTTILISHRPRVILRADLVVYLERGELKLSGTPAALAQIPGDHLDFLTP
jgi:ATP-binding cassette, subfamily C, bacterial